MKLREQRLIGLALIAISALVLLLACTGTTPEDRDATVVLLILPLGLSMIFSKIDFLGGYEPEEPEEQERPRVRRSRTSRATTPAYTATTYRLKGAITWQEKE